MHRVPWNSTWTHSHGLNLLKLSSIFSVQTSIFQLFQSCSICNHSSLSEEAIRLFHLSKFVLGEGEILAISKSMKHIWFSLHLLIFVAPDVRQGQIPMEDTKFMYLWQRLSSLGKNSAVALHLWANKSQVQESSTSYELSKSENMSNHNALYKRNWF